MRKFIDDSHSIEEKYDKIIDIYQNHNIEETIVKLKKLIKKDSDYYDIEGAHDYIFEAANRAIKRITDDQGNWPDRLEWIFIENRHIIRALYNQAILFWRSKFPDPALDLFKKLLHMNPPDNL